MIYFKKNKVRSEEEDHHHHHRRERKRGIGRGKGGGGGSTNWRGGGGAPRLGQGERRTIVTTAGREREALGEEKGEVDRINEE